MYDNLTDNGKALVTDIHTLQGMIQQFKLNE